MSESPVAELVVARLTVRSSYVHNVEQPAGADHDTVQFYLPADGASAFQIRTFVIDHDIHVRHIAWQTRPPEGFALAHLERVYGDVLGSVSAIPLPRLSTEDLTAAGLVTGALELVAEPGYAFWNPDGGHYTTKSEPIRPGERDGLSEVVYLGGIARFWLPSSWELHMSPEQGGHFFDPDGDSALRLNVLTFDTSAGNQPPRVRHKLKPNERAVDGGTLLSGHEFDVYELDALDEGTRLRFWQIAQVLPGQCRIFVFSYAYPIEEDHTEVLAVLDREIRRMVPYPEVV